MFDIQMNLELATMLLQGSRNQQLATVDASKENVDIFCLGSK